MTWTLLIWMLKFMVILYAAVLMLCVYLVLGLIWLFTPLAAAIVARRQRTEVPPLTTRYREWASQTGRSYQNTVKNTLTGR
ncbi:hypothetical protein [Amycolatopsis minnesotensis]|uniref:Uncharacterized protein n=1 Tax=Amycolatopsis minnesotensis TaxID=337894 RepID=A0ABN2R871_9PSEU